MFLKNWMHHAGARWIGALLAGLIVSAAISSFQVFAQSCEEISGDVLRLHILANSDSKEDQMLKLAVRDRILELDQELLAQADDLDDMKQLAGAELGRIEEIARQEVRRQGYSYDVQAELTHMYFTTREYGSIVLPAGWYDAVRITIGSGEGHNWWCVLYPPLCLPAAEAAGDPEEMLQEVLGEKNAQLLLESKQYEYELFLWEVWETIRNFLIEKGILSA